MKPSKFLNTIYFIGTICICVIVFSLINEKNTLIQSSAQNYGYWENEDEYEQSQLEVDSPSNNDEILELETVESSCSNSKNPTSSKNAYSKKTSSNRVSSKYSSSKRISSKKTSSRVASSNAVLSRTTLPKTTTSKAEEYTGIVNINSGSFLQLCSLDGIGEVTAQNIIDFRKSCGGFNCIDEIMNVKGIGEIKFNTIKNRITV